MPTWLSHACHTVAGWASAHFAPVPFILGLVIVPLAVWAVSLLATRMTVRRVFGNRPLPTVQQSAAQIQQAQAESARLMTQARDELAASMTGMLNQMQADVERMVEAAQEGELPLTVVVQSPEERQILESMITRGNTRVVYRQVTTNTTRTTKLREELPTAWDRILSDDEDGSCPKKPTSETKPKAPPKRPPAKPKAPKKTKG